MAPTNPLPVLVIGVLGIMNQQVDVARKLVSRSPQRSSGDVLGPKNRFVIRQIGKGLPIDGYAVSERSPGVDYEIGADLEWADGEVARPQFVQNESRNVPQPNRKQRRRQVPAEFRRQSARTPCRSPDVHLRIRVEERAQESKSLNVVHMQMGEKNVNWSGVGLLGSVHYPGTRIQQQNAPVIRRHLNR